LEHKNILQNYLLGPILGIDDPRTSKRIDFVGGIRGTEELVRLVDTKKFQVAFSLYPSQMQEVIFAHPTLSEAIIETFK